MKNATLLRSVAAFNSRGDYFKTMGSKADKLGEAFTNINKIRSAIEKTGFNESVYRIFENSREFSNIQLDFSIPEDVKFGAIACRENLDASEAQTSEVMKTFLVELISNFDTAVQELTSIGTTSATAIVDQKKTFSDAVSTLDDDKFGMIEYAGPALSVVESKIEALSNVFDKIATAQFSETVAVIEFIRTSIAEELNTLGVCIGNMSEPVVEHTEIQRGVGSTLADAGWDVKAVFDIADKLVTVYSKLENMSKITATIKTDLENALTYVKSSESKPDNVGTEGYNDQITATTDSAKCILWFCGAVSKTISMLTSIEIGIMTSIESITVDTTSEDTMADKSLEALFNEVEEEATAVNTQEEIDTQAGHEEQDPTKDDLNATETSEPTALTSESGGLENTDDEDDLEDEASEAPDLIQDAELDPELEHDELAEDEDSDIDHELEETAEEEVAEHTEPAPEVADSDDVAGEDDGELDETSVDEDGLEDEAIEEVPSDDIVDEDLGSDEEDEASITAEGESTDVVPEEIEEESEVETDEDLTPELDDVPAETEDDDVAEVDSDDLDDVSDDVSGDVAPEVTPDVEPDADLDDEDVDLEDDVDPESTEVEESPTDLDEEAEISPDADTTVEPEVDADDEIDDLDDSATEETEVEDLDDVEDDDVEEDLEAAATEGLEDEGSDESSDDEKEDDSEYETVEDDESRTKDELKVAIKKELTEEIIEELKSKGLIKDDASASSDDSSSDESSADEDTEAPSWDDESDSDDKPEDTESDDEAPAKDASEEPVDEASDDEDFDLSDDEDESSDEPASDEKSDTEDDESDVEEPSEDEKDAFEAEGEDDDLEAEAAKDDTSDDSADEGPSDKESITELKDKVAELEAQLNDLKKAKK